MREERLDNGLCVILKRVPNKVVTLDAWVNTGSANEDAALNGMSHFLEHMMFKGTPRYATGELDKAITSVGGVWNAGTSKDFTHYYVTVAAPFFAIALDAISDMLMNASIDPAEFDKEKPVILEEYRRKQDNPWGVLYDELYEDGACPRPLPPDGTRQLRVHLRPSARHHGRLPPALLHARQHGAGGGGRHRTRMTRCARWRRRFAVSTGAAARSPWAESVD